MERRRYIPSSLGQGTQLEERKLMAASSTSIFNLFNSPTSANNLPTNLQQRLQRVQNLPYIMESYQRDRALPPSVIAPIQDDLRSIVSLIHDPTHAVLNNFNRAIRTIDPTKHLIPGQAENLINAFDQILVGSGTPDFLRTKFTADMTALARLDAGGAEPSFQAANDFSIISELVQAIGQPFQPPSQPTLAPADQLKRSAVTTNPTPSFFGYGTAGTGVRIVDLNNDGILAQGFVPASGQYTFKSSVTLPNGLYPIVAQTFEFNYVSLASKPYTFRVAAPQPKPAVIVGQAVPQGPAG